MRTVDFREEAALGVTIPFGGVHPLMGTHNHLLRLGAALFLEIIAPDPAAGPLPRPRWFFPRRSETARGARRVAAPADMGRRDR